MQTALAVREAVMSALGVMLFVSVYMATTLVLVASSDWRLSIPMLVWLILYIWMMSIFLPRLRRVSTVQADARSLMTGRIVDSYTNITTLKLFSQLNREEHYVREGMADFLDTVHPQMRLVTWLNVSMWVLNMWLICGVGGFGIYLWLNSGITPGAIAIAMGIAIRLAGMSHWVMWEVSNLFENIGTVKDGMDTLTLPQTVNDQPNAGDLTVSRGEISFEQVRFAYNDSKSIFSELDLQVKPKKKWALWGALVRVKLL